MEFGGNVTRGIMGVQVEGIEEGRGLSKPRFRDGMDVNVSRAIITYIWNLEQLMRKGGQIGEGVVSKSNVSVME